MACRYYDTRKKMCKNSTQCQTLNQDTITQYCKGNSKKCPNFNRTGGLDVVWSQEQRAQNKKAKARGDNIRLGAPVAFIAVLLLCLFKLHMDLLLSIGGAMFAGLVVLLFTNRYH